MKKKKPEITQNFLEYIPEKSKNLTWNTDSDGKVTLDVENTGIFNKAAQKMFNKPRYTHIHLDELGSFVWPLIDGQKNIIALGKEVETAFGDKAAPLYERLAKYFQILESYHFIQLK